MSSSNAAVIQYQAEFAAWMKKEELYLAATQTQISRILDLIKKIETISNQHGLAKTLHVLSQRAFENCRTIERWVVSQRPADAGGLDDNTKLELSQRLRREAFVNVAHLVRNAEDICEALQHEAQRLEKVCTRLKSTLQTKEDRSDRSRQGKRKLKDLLDEDEVDGREKKRIKVSVNELVS